MRHAWRVSVDGMQRTFIVVSGLPGSGKTTLGRKLATALHLPYYDKDDILDGLLETLGAADPAWRQKLSRASDEVLIRLVTSSAGAVVASFWRTVKTPKGSGTPIDWLEGLSANVLEIHCSCSPETAAARFKERRRHPGHWDDPRSLDELIGSFRTLSEAGPLGLGDVIVVDTGTDSDLAALVEEIRVRRG